MLRSERWWFPLTSGVILTLAACATAVRTVPPEWIRSAPPQIRSVRFGADGAVLPSAVDRVARLADGRAAVAARDGGFVVTWDGSPVTPAFAAIESLDLSEPRGEIVFSARRERDFDIGLVATSGGEVSWLPGDPSDEVDVQWAPRGHKVSYVIRAPGGDVIRTLHVPTSFQFSIDFPFAHVHDVAWDAAAERMAVLLTAPDKPSHVEVVHYDGSERRIAVPPASQARLTVEPVAGGLLLRPEHVEYEQRLPLVIWKAEPVNEWSAARASLVQDARAACLIVPELSRAALDTVLQAPWVAADEVFVVGAARDDLLSSPPALVIVPREGNAPGTYRREGRVVSVSPAVVQSFAAAYIADQLKKRTSPPNGSSR